MRESISESAALMEEESGLHIFRKVAPPSHPLSANFARSHLRLIHLKRKLDRAEVEQAGDFELKVKIVYQSWSLIFPILVVFSCGKVRKKAKKERKRALQRNKLTFESDDY